MVKIAKKILVMCIILIMAMPMQAKKAKAHKVTQNFEVQEITKIYDGDTITVNLACSEPLFCKKISIRVYGIDTPEMHGGTNTKKEKYLARLAKRITVNFVKDSEKIYLDDCFRGKYFRLVCKVRNDKGRYLEDVLINSTLAVPYFGGTKTRDWSK